MPMSTTMTRREAERILYTANNATPCQRFRAIRVLAQTKP